eukprot:1158655-Pelagomonas_calceolata.AAC.3
MKAAMPASRAQERAKSWLHALAIYVSQLLLLCWDAETRMHMLTAAHQIEHGWMHAVDEISIADTCGIDCGRTPLRVY